MRVVDWKRLHGYSVRFARRIFVTTGRGDGVAYFVRSEPGCTSGATLGGTFFDRGECRGAPVRLTSIRIPKITRDGVTGCAHTWEGRAAASAANYELRKRKDERVSRRVSHVRPSSCTAIVTLAAECTRRPQVTIRTTEQNGVATASDPSQSEATSSCRARSASSAKHEPSSSNA